MKNIPAKTSVYADPKAPLQELTPEQRAILNAVPMLSQSSVISYVQNRWPSALQSPLATAMQGASAMAQLEASDADQVLHLAELRETARQWAQKCINACGGWTVESLSVQIECATDGELDTDECDAIARAEIAKATGGQP